MLGNPERLQEHVPPDHDHSVLYRFGEDPWVVDVLLQHENPKLELGENSRVANLVELVEFGDLGVAFDETDLVPFLVNMSGVISTDKRVTFSFDLSSFCKLAKEVSISFFLFWVSLVEGFTFNLRRKLRRTSRRFYVESHIDLYLGVILPYFMNPQKNAKKSRKNTEKFFSPRYKSHSM